MDKLIDTSKELLSSGKVSLIIGFEKGTDDFGRPAFAMRSDDCDKFIFDESCKQNLAIYLKNENVHKHARKSLFANIYTLRSLVILAAENQIKDDEVVAIFKDKENEIFIFETIQDITKYLERKLQSDKEQFEYTEPLMEKLENMTPSERIKFWMDELSKCFKCYACRAACPMCYCDRCTVEINQPQWISVPATTLGVVEWHMMRAMHLAGRCSGCDACYTACPLDIPIHLLSKKVTKDIESEFGIKTGITKDSTYSLSDYKPNDKENFIK